MWTKQAGAVGTVAARWCWRVMIGSMRPVGKVSSTTTSLETYYTTITVSGTIRVIHHHQRGYVLCHWFVAVADVLDSGPRSCGIQAIQIWLECIEMGNRWMAFDLKCFIMIREHAIVTKLPVWSKVE